MPTWNLFKRKGGIFAETVLTSDFVVVPESAMLSVITQVEICLLILKHIRLSSLTTVLKHYLIIYSRT